jgi:hypothetical protein
MKNILMTVFLAAVVFSCKTTENEQIDPEFEDFSNIKSDDWKSKIGQEITVEGYLLQVSENVFKIVNDSNYASLNTFLDQKNYILVQTNAGASSFNPFAKLGEMNGQKIKATGTLSMFQPKNTAGESIIASAKLIGEKHLATIVLNTMPLALSGQKMQIATSEYFNLGVLKNLPKDRTKFALLYSGGIDAMQAYTHYYNNIQVMYNLLLKQGYAPENIVVVYKDGAPETIIPSSIVTVPRLYPQIPVHYAANPVAFDEAISYLKKIMAGQKAELFVMTTNHGGGYHSAEKVNYSGNADLNSDEPTGASTDFDEVLSYYNQSQTLSDDDFAKKINSLPFVVLKGLFLQCFSGGFVHDLRGPNRVLISATTEYEYSWGRRAYDLDAYMTHFLYPFSLFVIPPYLFDINKDGVLQMNEIFKGAKVAEDIYNKEKPSQKSTSLYDDDGDGKHNNPSDTGFGSKITL